MIDLLCFAESSLAETIVSRLITASWQGGLFLVFAWAICKCWKQLSASTRCWIWRLAYAKFVLLILFGCVLELPVLPHPQAIENNPTATASSSSITGNGIAGLGPLQISGTNEVEPMVELHERSQQTAEFSRGANLSTSQIMLGLWSLGVLGSLILLFKEYFRVRGLVHGSIPVSDPMFLNQYRKIWKRFNLRRPPGLLLSRSARSPILIGVLKPVILLPEKFLKSCELEEIEMVLAHELAHVKRRDLLWNWLPAVVRSLFFFHPLVWMFQSRYALDQEVACDYLALNGDESETPEYGNLLIKVASGQPAFLTPGLGAIGVASSFRSLKKRILEMSQFAVHQSHVSRWLSGIVLGAALLAITPISLVAQKEETKIVKKTLKKESGSKVVKKPVDEEPKVETKNGARSVDAEKTKPGNVSISVSEGEETKALRIRNIKNGKVEVTYSKTVDGERDVKKYLLKDFGQLAEKNKEAFAFFKKHVDESTTTSGTSVASSFGDNPLQSKLKGQNIRLPKSNSSQSSDSSSQSSSSSAWESFSSISKNGVTQNRRNFGTTGNGVVGGGNKQLMIDQINKMINEADDPNLKNALQKMLDQVKNAK